MAQKVIMPKQGLQMTEGTITKWLVKEGEPVKENQPLFEMETDKLTISIDANYTGTLLKIVKDEGETVPITETIAIIGELGEDISGLLSEDNAVPILKETDKSERILATPRAKTTAASRDIDLCTITGTGPDGLIIERDIPSTAAARKVSPTAQKITELSGICISEITGSGENGKVMKADVLKLLSLSEAPKQEDTIIEITGMRKAIFENMQQSLHTMAQANHRMKVDMSEAVRLREKLKESGKKVGFTDILIKVASEALIKYPIMNSSVADNKIIMKHTVNMGVAVALDNGLIVPNIKNSQTLNLEQISSAVTELAEKARTGKLKRDEYTGGTFTITNLGMYDIDEFTAIINPPEAAILAVGKITDTPVCIKKTVEVRPVLTLSLTYDHRIIDGAPAAQFLQYIKKLLENPYLLV